MNVLLTGATGSVGSLLRPYLARNYTTVVLNSRKPIADLRQNEIHRPGDICDPNVVDGLLEGIDGIIHLAALVGPDFTFEETLGPNFTSVYHLFEAARSRSVKKVVYASTHHAVGFFERGTPVDHNTAPRPDSWYGVTKACGEILSSYYVDTYGFDVMCIRIGYVEDSVPDERRMHTWCSARDLAALIDIGLRGSQAGFHVVYGVSNCPEPLFDNAHAESLGYTPMDLSTEHLIDPRIADVRPDKANPNHRYIGGHFAKRLDQ